MTFLSDGWQTLIEFAEKPDILLREKTVKPPGIDGGGSIDTTTMRNETVRTFEPKHLKTITESTVSVSYDPAAYNDIMEMIQVKQLITITFPDGSTLPFWGFLDKFEINELSEGEFPLADCTIAPCNTDDDGDEVVPEMEAAG